ncbi:MAG: phosphoribosylformylglycinamidine synthase subunit PurQ [Planctomycetota bacterium]|nr:phosphoribosylformylglycinamidine synthase subunit PurQ [Planctomycetota bacterium]
MPTALVITTAGINCDLELRHAFEMAGANVESIHLNTLMKDPDRIDEFDLIGLPGGFSYGDAIAAGRISAQLMRQKLYTTFIKAIDRGVPIFAPCNGFQMVAQMGLVPGPEIVGQSWPETAPTPKVTLAENAKARFVDRWVNVEIPADTRCIWTQGLDVSEAALMLPIAHGEGRFIAESDDLLQYMEENGQIAIRYASDDNPNGSMGDIAGICDSTGLVFGLMPHPERYTRWTQHPFWTSLDAEATQEEPLGLKMFRNAVAHASQQSKNGALIS